MNVLSWDIQTRHPNLPTNDKRYPHKNAVVMRLPKPSSAVKKTALCFTEVCVGHLSVRAMPVDGGMREFQLVVEERSDIFDFEMVLASHCELRKQKIPTCGLWKQPPWTFSVVKPLRYDRLVRRQLIAAAYQFFTEYQLGFSTLYGKNSELSSFITDGLYSSRKFLCKGDHQKDWLSPEDLLCLDLTRVQEKAEAAQARSDAA